MQACDMRQIRKMMSSPLFHHVSLSSIEFRSLTLSVFGVGQLDLMASPAGPSQNFGCFCEGTGTNFEACELNFVTAHVITRKGVFTFTNTSYCRPLSVSEPSRDLKPYYHLLMGLYCA